MKYISKSVRHSALITTGVSIPRRKPGNGWFICSLRMLIATLMLSYPCAATPFTFSYTGSLSTARTA